MLYLILIVALVLDVLAAVLAAAETSVMLLSPGRVHRLVEAEQQTGAEHLEALMTHAHRVRAASALLAGLAFGFSALLGMLVGDVLPQIGSFATGIVAALAIVLLTFALFQSLPRTLAVANPERIGLGIAVTAVAVTRAVYPLARLLGVPWSWVTSLAGDERPSSAWATGSDYRFAESDEAADRQEAEEALLEAVSDFADKVTREIMVPRTDMAALPDTATLEDAVALIESSGYSRIPIFHGTVDDIRGVVYAKDLLVAVARRDSSASVSSLARRPYFVPETKPVEELLFEMRTQTHIAIVADEYGGTAGLITLEDLLEEIVGEISDEYDREVPLIIDLGEGRYRIDARLPVDDLNELFGTDIDIDADSVGGLFTEVAGHIPVTGESLEIEGLTLTVEVTEGTRIRQLTVDAAEDTEGARHDA